MDKIEEIMNILSSFKTEINMIVEEQKKIEKKLDNHLKIGGRDHDI